MSASDWKALGIRASLSMTMALATNKNQSILSIPSPPLHPAERSWKAHATHPPRQGLSGRTDALLH